MYLYKLINQSAAQSRWFSCSAVREHVQAFRASRTNELKAPIGYLLADKSIFPSVLLVGGQKALLMFTPRSLRAAERSECCRRSWGHSSVCSTRRPPALKFLAILIKTSSALHLETLQLERTNQKEKVCPDVKVLSVDSFQIKHLRTSFYFQPAPSCVCVCI